MGGVVVSCLSWGEGQHLACDLGQVFESGGRRRLDRGRCGEVGNRRGHDAWCCAEGTLPFVTSVNTDTRPLLRLRLREKASTERTRGATCDRNYTATPFVEVRVHNFASPQLRQ